MRGVCDPKNHCIVWRWLRCHARGVPELVKRSLLTLQVAHSEELEALQKLLHFPEEVALRLADTEYHLFYQVPPIDYLRQVTLDLGGGTGDVHTSVPGPGTTDHPHQPAAENATSASASAARPSVRSLIKRFNEVHHFIYHTLVSNVILMHQRSIVLNYQLHVSDFLRS